MIIKVADVLACFVGRGCVPSTMQAQLDRLQFGFDPNQDPHRARREVEDHMLQQAVLYRCIDDFARRTALGVQSRQRKSASGYRALEALQDNSSPYHSQGAIATGILRAFQERAKGSQEQGLVAVYHYIQSIAPKAVPLPPKGDGDILQLFRLHPRAPAREFTCDAHADALFALEDHLREFNKRESSPKRSAA